ncbi:hypothetical protein H8356DRAFT_1325466 [Neocallimastix lanati (nom. inval.)]|nr:hypothetical protein H8356DRAFT_1325466 [Neocallimastix sp. JGI-2020a]
MSNVSFLAGRAVRRLYNDTVLTIFTSFFYTLWLAGRAVRRLHNDTDDTGSDLRVVVSFSSFFKNFEVLIVA